MLPSARLTNAVYQLLIKPYFFVQPQADTLAAVLPNYTVSAVTILSRYCHDCHEAVTMQVGDYPALERDAEAGFYFTSPVLGQLMPRLPNTVNLGFIHCRCGHSRAVTGHSRSFTVPLPSHRPGSPLAPSLTRWLEAGQDPVIFMSMGSIYQVQDHVLDLFQQVQYLKLPYYYTSAKKM